MAAFAALVIGVNFARRFQLPKTAGEKRIRSTVTPSTNPKQIDIVEYTSSHCGLKFSSETSFNQIEAGDGNAIFIDPANPRYSFTIICQKDLPQPMATESAEAFKIGTVSAMIFNTVSPVGTRSSTLIFNHPVNQLGVIISGTGELIDRIKNTFQIK
ncbi:hypothetical protein A2154_04650 [Candidatus Gottesmanbacteria bacterium RBG_16_43_7]|uniref:Uncharacterized protein n=1 Tax=Candidatus Gottesmanbacteria bacterium RBG_16_43_7 TaxID=1798373 RepID=A0A1F5Z8X4_9BACT|nr:MAG: hypothetical protein A2154_04650 [Candidatus Gottesmanbacteria bacterium RBG_16_43_7]